MKRNTNKRWLFLLGALVLTVILAACSGRSQPHNDESHSQANGNDGTINVTLQEMSVSLDRSQLKAGTITFVVQNNGFLTHDFAIRGNGIDQKTPTLNSGESATLTVD
jgi:DNA/RNA endonuclease YhcR with UshA esterase domain